MTFGVTNEGFVQKRLEDILLELRQDAAVIFQDLVEPGDVVDTSDSSTLGRFINLIAVPEAELWENSQLVYSAFDPNSAEGIALDNLIELSGIPARRGNTYSNTTGVVSGEIGTIIPQNSIVGSNVHNNTFRTSRTTTITADAAVGVLVDVASVANITTYQILYSTSSGLATNVVTFTSDGSASRDEILEGLLLNIATSHPDLSGSITEDGLVVDKVSVFQSSNFETSGNLIITQASKTVSLIAEEAGPVKAEAGTINVIKTPVIGWNSVINPLGVTLGAFTETDDQLRLRFYSSRFERSRNTLDAIYSALTSLEGVESVFVYENDTDFVNALGIPPHSFTVVILGGDEEEIAQAIWANKPIGIPSVWPDDPNDPSPPAGEEVTIYDVKNFPHIIRFTRPQPINIFINITLATYPNYPSDGASRIRSAIIDFARDNFGVGQDVIYSRLYTPINEVDGHSITDLRIGTSPSPTGQSDVSIDFDQIANFTSINIQITENPVL